MNLRERVVGGDRQGVVAAVAVALVVSEAETDLVVTVRYAIALAGVRLGNQVPVRN